MRYGITALEPCTGRAAIALKPRTPTTGLWDSPTFSWDEFERAGPAN